jgi:hypothetical protein
MTSISIFITTRRIKNGCVTEGEWFSYTSGACIEEEGVHNADGGSYKEGDDDDDDDGGYDYAPAA